MANLVVNGKIFERQLLATDTREMWAGFVADMFGKNAQFEITLDVKDAQEVIKDEHAKALESLSGNVSVAERDTWTEQKEAAKAHKAGNATAIQMQMLKDSCKKGESIDQLAAKILMLVDINLLLTGKANGVKRKAEQALERGDNPETVLEQAKVDMADAIQAFQSEVIKIKGEVI